MDWHLSTLLKFFVPNRAQETTQLLYLWAIRTLLFQVNLLAQRKKKWINSRKSTALCFGVFQRKRSRLSLANAGFEKARICSSQHQPRAPQHGHVPQNVPLSISYPSTAGFARWLQKGQSVHRAKNIPAVVVSWEMPIRDGLQFGWQLYRMCKALLRFGLGRPWDTLSSFLAMWEWRIFSRRKGIFLLLVLFCSS